MGVEESASAYDPNSVLGVDTAGDDSVGSGEEFQYAARNINDLGWYEEGVYHTALPTDNGYIDYCKPLEAVETVLHLPLPCPDYLDPDQL